jgi:Tol biopolymer transport system component/predicted Ser/Thr protein kinase
MDPERWRNIEKLYESVVERSPAERAALLAQADPDIRREVEVLLAQPSGGALLDQPAADLLGESSVIQLPAGTQVGHYQIVAMLGQGGMGMVYRAKDTKLGREVAIKVLPDSLAQDPDRLARFNREAKVLASLNHPNIGQIYGVESQALVMELVEGETLSSLIKPGPLPIETALNYARQIAEALEAAHEKGIIHRDLKPANIMVTLAGVVKVLDFGLAKAEEPSANDLAASPATTLSPTRAGIILGTAAYMSPEQARGAAVDKRSDIWAFGVVLYEMLTGRRAFPGESVTDILAGVLRGEPDWSALPSATPPRIRKLLQRCLERDRKQRLQAIGEARIAIGAPEQDAKAQPRRRAMVWAGICLTALAVVGVVWVLVSTRGRDSTGLPSREIPLTGLPGWVRNPSFSPDGKQIAYRWRTEGGDSSIYVKLIGTGTTLRLTNPPGVDSIPAWSPDGEWVVFFRSLPGNSGIYIVSALGGPARRITPTEYCGGLDWFPDGKHLIVSEGLEDSTRLSSVAVDTGQHQPAASNSGAPLGDTDPALSPDGKTIAFIGWTASRVGNIYLMPVDGGRPRWLATNARSIAWMPDGRAIVFSSEQGRLWRIPVTGGTPQAVTSSAEVVSAPAIARRGNRLAYVVSESNGNLWRIDLTGTIPPVAGPPARLENSTRTQWDPSYSPDGSWLVFGSNRSGFAELWVGDLEGRGAVQLTKFEASRSGTPRWSPDGSWIAFDSRPNGKADIFVVRPDGGTPRRVTTHSGENVVPSWSRDGRWIYFMSMRSGEQQIWKVPADTGESPSTPAVQVTQGGGIDAFESADGRYLYYAKGRGKKGLWRKPLSVPNGREEPVLESLQYWGWWALAPQGIYFLEEPELPRLAKVRLKFFDLASKRITELATLEKPVNRTTPSICLSPDGRNLVYTQTDRDGSDIMLVENFH